MGYDPTDIRDVENLVTAMRYTELRLSDRRITDPEICSQINITVNMLAELKRTEAMRVVTQMMLTEFWNEQSRKDIRARIFRSLHEGIPDTLDNVIKIAAGRPIGKDDAGKNIHAQVRDQVAAATLLLNNPMADAWLKTTFVGEAISEEATPLDQAMLEQTRVLNLDDVVDGEFKEHTIIQGQLEQPQSESVASE